VLRAIFVIWLRVLGGLLFAFCVMIGVLGVIMPGGAIDFQAGLVTVGVGGVLLVIFLGLARLLDRTIDGPEY
jgi:hypothetical protein